jgi:hypothetical protein
MFETLESRQFCSATPTTMESPAAAAPAATAVEANTLTARRAETGTVPQLGGAQQLVVISIIGVLIG